MIATMSHQKFTRPVSSAAGNRNTFVTMIATIDARHSSEHRHLAPEQHPAARRATAKNGSCVQKCLITSRALMSSAPRSTSSTSEIGCEQASRRCARRSHTTGPANTVSAIVTATIPTAAPVITRGITRRSPCSSAAGAETRYPNRASASTSGRVIAGAPERQVPSAHQGVQRKQRGEDSGADRDPHDRRAHGDCSVEQRELADES